MVEHFKRWNRWQKNNTNSKWHKFLVLIGLIHSPTFGVYKWNDDIKKALNQNK